MEKLKEDICTRHNGTSDKCDYWEVIKKADGVTGYNYWRLVEVVTIQKGFIEDNILARLEVTMHGFGRRMSSRVQGGRFGVYTVDD